MKRTAFFLILSALAWPLAATSALGQDAPADPEAGDTGGAMPAGGAQAEGSAQDDEMPSAGTDTTAAAAPDDAVAAPEAGPQKPVSIGLLLGYGISLKSGGNPWGLGFGARGGYNLDKIYLGARFVFYLGDSQSATFNGVTSERSFNVWEIGVEAGYDIDLGGLVVRPEFGLGLANSSSDVTGTAFNTADNGSTDLYLAPGASFLYDVTPDIFLGVDTRLQLVLATGTPTSLIFLANGGMHF